MFMNNVPISSTTDRAIDVSFEFFPPKTADMEEVLWQSIAHLAPLAPKFVSVTYGAGGTTRERTHATLERLIRETPLKPAAHLTCVAATRADVDKVVQDYYETGVRHIVALRGDPPAGLGTQFEPHPEGYQTSTDLIKGIKRIADFEISVSAYPEKHPESRTFDDDLDVLQSKLEAGANRAITQFFFENARYFRYLDRVQARQMDISIVPGIAPIQNFRQMANFARKAGANVPQWLSDRFENLENNPAEHRKVAVALAAEQVIELLEQGITQFHFYTMNRADMVFAICYLLGLRPDAAAHVAA